MDSPPTHKSSISGKTTIKEHYALGVHIRRGNGGTALTPKYDRSFQNRYSIYKMLEYYISKPCKFTYPPRPFLWHAMEKKIT
jgi:hypothetical protein